MILEMKVPSPGESITEVEIATWMVEDGDYVEKDQVIAEVDSDKATLELPAEESGIITLKAEEGDAVEVGAIVCLIDLDGKKLEGAASTKSVEKTSAKEVENQLNLLLPMQPDLHHLLQKKYWLKKEWMPQLLKVLVKMVELPKRML